MCLRFCLSLNKDHGFKFRTQFGYGSFCLTRFAIYRSLAMLKFAERLFGWSSIQLFFVNVLSFDAEFALCLCVQRQLHEMKTVLFSFLPFYC